MKFTGPDAAILAAHDAHVRALSPKSQAFGQTGEEPDYRCANRKKCGNVRNHVQTHSRGVITLRCRRCGTPWPTTETLTLAGQFSSSSGGRPPAALIRTGDLCVLVRDLESTEELEPGEAAIYSLWLVDGSRSREKMAAECSAKRFQGREWSPRDVRNAIRRSRAWLSNQLERRGLTTREGGFGSNA